MFDRAPEKLIIALDKDHYSTPNPREEAIEHLHRMCDALSPLGVTVKINSLARVIGATAIEFIHDQGLNCFLDLKLFDTDATIKNDFAWIRHYAPQVLTVSERIKPSTFEFLKETLSGTLVLPVGPLTDLDNDDFMDLAGHDREQEVREFFERAWKHRARGVVCAPIDIVHAAPGFRKSAYFITPAVKPAWAFIDQNSKHARTPAEAIRLGADAVVVGRGIVDQPNIIAAADRVLSDIREAL